MGGVKEQMEVCLFPDSEETGDILCKEKNVKVSKSAIKDTGNCD